MDRTLAYSGQQPDTFDILRPQKNAVIGLGKLAEAVLGSSTMLSGLAVIPVEPAALAIQVLPGQIFAQVAVDVTNYSDEGNDNHLIVKQGILHDATNLTISPPTTLGYEQQYLIQAAFSEADADPMALNYYNPAMLTDPDAQPWTGPNNSGDEQPTTRKAQIVLNAKPGVAAAAGTSVTPTPDVGNVGIAIVKVAQGATYLTSANILPYETAPFIPEVLPAIPEGVLEQRYVSAPDSGTKNHVIAKLAFRPTAVALKDGMRICVKAAVTNDAAAYLRLYPFAELPVVLPNGSATAGGEIVANCWADYIYTSAGGGKWQLAGTASGGGGGGGSPGSAGADGSVIYAGATAPDVGLGVNRDIYMQSNGDVYRKVSGAWVLQFNIRGPQGLQGIQGPQGLQGIQGALAPDLWGVDVGAIIICSAYNVAQLTTGGGYGIILRTYDTMYPSNADANRLAKAVATTNVFAPSAISPIIATIAANPATITGAQLVANERGLSGDSRKDLIPSTSVWKPISVLLQYVDNVASESYVGTSDAWGMALTNSVSAYFSVVLRRIS